MDQFEKALAFALKAHEGQLRKNGKTPYILHPCEAAAIAATMTDDRDILSAVLLHDTLEDTDTTIDEIREAFGDRVAELVQGETELPHTEMSREESWMLRKEESLARLRDTDDVGVKIMWLSDKLSNLRSFCRMYEKMGDQMWERFSQKDKSKQAQYYRRIGDLLAPLSDTVAYMEYTQLLTYIFGGNHEN